MQKILTNQETIYFDVKPTNLQEMLEVFPISHNAGMTMLQKVLNHIL